MLKVMREQINHLPQQFRPLPYDVVASVLQGGGALGAYQAGVYEGLHEAGIRPNWLAGISIGAVALTLFFAIELNLRILFRRDFGFGVLANFLLGVALYGSVYLARIQGYNSEQIGMVLA